MEPSPVPAVLDLYSAHTPNRALGDQYAMRALRERPAFMTGELEKLERRKRYLEEAIVHVDATLAMFSGDYDPTLVKARFPRRKSKLFGAGKLNGLILGTLRKADGRALSLSAIVAGDVADAGACGGLRKPACGAPCGRTCFISQACEA